MFSKVKDTRETLKKEAEERTPNLTDFEAQLFKKALQEAIREQKRNARLEQRKIGGDN